MHIGDEKAALRDHRPIGPGDGVSRRDGAFGGVEDPVGIRRLLDAARRRMTGRDQQAADMGMARAGLRERAAGETVESAVAAEAKFRDAIKERRISKNRICKDLDIPRSNFNRYCQGEFQRLDASLICKLCWYLKVDIGELIQYERPKETQENEDSDIASR